MQNNNDVALEGARLKLKLYSIQQRLQSFKSSKYYCCMRKYQSSELLTTAWAGIIQTTVWPEITRQRYIQKKI